jgi:hypothetical protein
LEIAENWTCPSASGQQQSVKAHRHMLGSGLALAASPARHHPWLKGTASLVPVGLGERHAEPLNQFTEMNQFMFGIVRGRDLDTYR